MQIVYEIPKHLQAYLSDMPETVITKVITQMLELAIRHDLIHFPDTFLERNVKDIREGITTLRSLMHTSGDTTETLLRDILSTLQQMKDSTAPVGIETEDATIDLSSLLGSEGDEVQDSESADDSDFDMSNFLDMISQGGEEDV